MRNRYWILNGRTPVQEDLLVWAAWFENDDNRRVAETCLGNVLISTVFLGIDHRFFGNGPPLLFETLVFGGPLNDEQTRCSTWEQAETAHALIVDRCRLAEKGS